MHTLDRRHRRRIKDPSSTDRDRRGVSSDEYIILLTQIASTREKHVSQSSYELTTANSLPSRSHNFELKAKGSTNENKTRK